MTEQSNGFMYNGYWIESYQHTFGECEREVWRVQTKQGGRILSKHLHNEEKAKEEADKWAKSTLKNS